MSYEIIYIVICSILSIIMTFRIYPFIGLADGFSRWNLALEIIENGGGETDTLLSPIISYIQAGTYKLTNSYALYTFLQCMFFYIAIAMLSNFLTDKKSIKKIPIWFVISLILLFIPTVYIFPTLLTDSAIIFSLISMGLWLAKRNSISIKFKLIMEFIILILLVSIRVNSLVLVVGLIAIIFFKKRLKSIFICALIILAGIIGAFIPSQLNPIKYNAISLGMIWELTGIVSENKNENLEYALSKYGDVEEAILRYNKDSLNSLVWDDNPPFPAKSIAGNHSKDIIKLYINTIVSDPMNFIKMKLSYISKSLGLTEPLISSARGIHYVDDITKLYGARDTYLQEKTRNDFIGFTDKISLITLRPWVLISISLSLIIIAILFKIQILEEVICTFLIGIFYYLSFLINTQAHEFRYYSPTFYILLILAFSLIFDIVLKLIFEYKYKK